MGSRVLICFTELPKKVLRDIYGLVKERSRADLKLIVGQEPYRAIGAIARVTKHRRYKVILQHTGEELKHSISSKKLKVIGGKNFPCATCF